MTNRPKWIVKPRTAAQLCLGAVALGVSVDLGSMLGAGNCLHGGAAPYVLEEHTAEHVVLEHSESTGGTASLNLVWQRVV